MCVCVRACTDETYDFTQIITALPPKNIDANATLSLSLSLSIYLSLSLSLSLSLWLFITNGNASAMTKRYILQDMPQVFLCYIMSSWWILANRLSLWRHKMEIFSALLVLCAGNLPVTGEFPHTKASDAELWCFLWSTPEQTVEQTLETPVIWDAIALILTSL